MSNKCMGAIKLFWIPIILLLIVWIICYIKNKKAMMVLPYLYLLFITPLYNLLDRYIFVEVFGCGCVPSTQTNMLNISFNANDLRTLVYFFSAVWMAIMGALNSKNFKNSNLRILYIFTIIICNLTVAYTIIENYKWN